MTIGGYYQEHGGDDSDGVEDQVIQTQSQKKG